MSPVNWAAFMKVTMTFKNLGIESNWLRANVSFLGLLVSRPLDNSVGIPTGRLSFWLFSLFWLLWYDRRLGPLASVNKTSQSYCFYTESFSSLSCRWVFPSPQTFIMCPLFNFSGRFFMASTNTYYSSSRTSFLLCTHPIFLAENGNSSPALDILACCLCNSLRLHGSKT